MATTPKTQPTDADVAAFLAQVEPERRRADAVHVADLLQRITGERPVMWGPAIVGYGTRTATYASGKTADWPPIAFSPRKSALTLYLIDGVDAHTEDLRQLGPHTTGKGCLYLKRLDAVDTDVLERILTDAWADRKRTH